MATDHRAELLDAMAEALATSFELTHRGLAHVDGELGATRRTFRAMLDSGIINYGLNQPERSVSAEKLRLLLSDLVEMTCEHGKTRELYEIVRSYRVLGREFRHVANQCIECGWLLPVEQEEEVPE